jgi:hypothetical protein
VAVGWDMEMSLRTRDTANLVNNTIDHFLANGVVSASICGSQSPLLSPSAGPLTIVGRIFLATDEQLGMEELAVWSRANLINGLNRGQCLAAWMRQRASILPKGPGRQKWSGERICHCPSR